MFNVSDEICNTMTGCPGEVVAAPTGQGLFKTMFKIKYNTGEVYYTAPEFLTDVSQSSSIIRANKRRRSTAADDE
jgi:hypothetical protein